MNQTTDVLFSVMSGQDGDLGVITLNRPQVLNSLNHDMIRAMQSQLSLWAVEASIKAVVVLATEGRAFCAGGDIRLTYDRCVAGDPLAAIFFRDEYHLNQFIFHFPKPYIALLDGITMGGGVGISIHGSHRVATERLLFAMPETGIGFYPDVGGTYFLSRLRSHLGFYLGLTGARLKTDDAVAVGIATHHVKQSALPALLAALSSESFGPDARQHVTQIISRFATPAGPSSLLANESALDAIFSGETVEDILQKLSHETSDFFDVAKEAFHRVSPTSLKVTLRALKAARHLDFDQAMQQEFRLTSRFLAGHDFREGIRAVVIDKTHAPHWKPSTLAAVTDQEVESYFSSMTAAL